MSVLCQNPTRPKHQIADGDRKVTLTAIIVWGQDDERGDWTGDYVFCSFGCLADWAATRAGDHDGIVLRNGVVEHEPPPKPPGPVPPPPKPAA